MRARPLFPLTAAERMCYHGGMEQKKEFLSAEALLAAAQAALRPMQFRGGEGGQVACALQTESGALYTGICIDLPCQLGFCAEQAAIAEMLKSGETRVRQLVAVNAEGRIYPPCGKCREVMYQIDEGNLQTEIWLSLERCVPLSALLPERWDEI